MSDKAMDVSLFARLKNAFWLFSLFVFLASCSSPKYTPRRNMTMVFYNVENLFDTVNTPGFRDGEFTPEGRNSWTGIRYQKKLQDLSRVIRGINPKELPEIIGLCEVENEDVVNDLVQTGQLAEGKYSVVHHESPDMRGIDCALIFRSDEFTLEHHMPISLKKVNGQNLKTRDILYVKARSRNGEEFHFFVNHWPSRIGGEAVTEAKRVAVAALLREKLDSVIMTIPEAHIVILGDMNDQPDNKSLRQVLGAQPPFTPGARLVNLMYPEFQRGLGSYKYNGKWQMLDNIIVTAALTDASGWRVMGQTGHVYKEMWMEHAGRNGNVSPNRTYQGSRYTGGPGDHFPVFIRLGR